MQRPDLLREGLKAAQPSKQPFDLLEQHGRLRARRKTPPRSVEQHEPDGLLEALNELADRRLRNRQPLRRPAYGAAFHYSPESVELAKVHRADPERQPLVGPILQKRQQAVASRPARPRRSAVHPSRAKSFPVTAPASVTVAAMTGASRPS